MVETRVKMIPKQHKYLFWFILAAYSTFFAEVFAGSDMFPFFNIWGIFIVVPLYGLHIILLTTIIFRYGKPTLSTLVFAGMLFGLYEAYMTKVLWQPSWDAALIIGEIAIIEIIVLVFWWHTWFSLITPLILAERMLTNSHHVLNGLPEKLQRFYSSWKGYLLLIIFGGIFQSINSPSVTHSLLSGISTGGMLILLTWIWNRVTREARYSLPDLLPNKKESHFLALWLAALYLFLGFSMFPERLPSMLGQGIIVGFYLLTIYLFIRALEISKSLSIAPGNQNETPKKYWFIIWGVFILTLVLARAFLYPALNLIILLSWGIGGSLSLFAFWQALKGIKKNAIHRGSAAQPDRP